MLVKRYFIILLLWCASRSFASASEVVLSLEEKLQQRKVHEGIERILREEYVKNRERGLNSYEIGGHDFFFGQMGDKSKFRTWLEEAESEKARVERAKKRTQKMHAQAVVLQRREAAMQDLIDKNNSN
jgi:hypothetical protein